jgi:hypothetical protein
MKYYFHVPCIAALGAAYIFAATSASAVIVFNDTFSSGSTLDTSYTAPDASSASYDLISSKSRSPAPTIASGHLKYGIAATTSGSIEAQAIFYNIPLTLYAPGDGISLTVVFTDTAGILTQNGNFDFGLYNSGQNTPVPGGADGVATSAMPGYSFPFAQNWVGYVAQTAFTGSNSRIMTRPAQTITTANQQDVVTSGSGSSSYAGSLTVGSQNIGGITLSAGTQYTAVLSIVVDGSGNQAITNSIYLGNGTGGTLLTQFGGITTAGTFQTNSIDALAIGWRATANMTASAIDVNQIIVDIPVPEPTIFALAGLGILGFTMASRLMRR